MYIERQSFRGQKCRKPKPHLTKPLTPNQIELTSPLTITSLIKMLKYLLYIWINRCPFFRESIYQGSAVHRALYQMLHACITPPPPPNPLTLAGASPSSGHRTHLLGSSPLATPPSPLVPSPSSLSGDCAGDEGLEGDSLLSFRATGWLVRQVAV